jgi:hypothetical protein
MALPLPALGVAGACNVHAILAPGTLAQLIPRSGTLQHLQHAAAPSFAARRGLSVLACLTAQPQQQHQQQQHQHWQQRRALASGGGPRYPDADDAADRGAGGTLRPATPWVRQVISGVDLMRHPKYNKGLAFSEAERDRLYLRGLLPPAVLSQEVQLERAILNVRSKEDALDRYSYLQSLQGRNERLFYRCGAVLPGLCSGLGILGGLVVLSPLPPPPMLWGSGPMLCRGGGAARARARACPCSCLVAGGVGRAQGCR